MTTSFCPPGFTRRLTASMSLSICTLSNLGRPLRLIHFVDDDYAAAEIDAHLQSGPSTKIATLANRLNKIRPIFQPWSGMRSFFPR